MSTIASRITSLTIVYSTVYPGADQSKHQSSASLAFVWEIHRSPVNSPHKWPVTRKMFPFDDVIMDSIGSGLIIGCTFYTKKLSLQASQHAQNHSQRYFGSCFKYTWYDNEIRSNERWGKSWQWRHKEHDGVSNPLRLDCLLKRLFRCTSKYQSAAWLAFVRGIHRWPVESPHKGPVTQTIFPFNDVIVWVDDSVASISHFFLSTHAAMVYSCNYNKRQLAVYAIL